MTRALLVPALLLGILPVISALAASNSVSSARLGRAQTAISPDDLKPSSCSALTLTTLVSGVTGTANSDLQLGGSAGQSMSAAGGNDCILAGGGNDSINCGAGTDVAIGGPGTDTFNSNCETQIQ